MKKTLSRLSYYLFMTCLIVRLISRLASFFTRIYVRSLCESRGNIALVNTILFGQLERVVKEGEITPEFEPYLTESLLFFMKAIGELKLEFDWSRQEYASHFSSKDKRQMAELGIIDFLFLSFLDEKKYTLPSNTRLSANAVVAISNFGLNVEDEIIARKDVKDKLVNLGSKPSFRIDPEEHPEIAISLIRSGKYPSGHDGWAKPKSVNSEWLLLLMEKNTPVGFSAIKTDIESLVLWGTRENNQKFVNEIYEDDERISHLTDMLSGCLRDGLKVTPAVYRCAQRVIKLVHPDITPDFENMPDPVRNLLPKNWRNGAHKLHRKSIKKLFLFGGKSKSSAISIAAENFLYPVTSNFFMDDLESQMILLKILWKLSHINIDLGDSRVATRRLINTQHSLIKKLCKNNKLNSETVVDYIRMNTEAVNYPANVARASTKRLLRLAIIKNCPYASHKLSVMDEDELLNIANNSFELSFIYDRCTTKKEENLSRYPDFVRDKHFAIDLGL